MRILTALTYYRPHYSGLTIYAERLAQALAQLGHRVTVLTSRYDHQLPSKETSHGVDILRLNVGVRLSKGVIMPSMPFQATRLVKQADVIHLHVPQLDAALIALISRVMRKPILLTYHCDLHLPSGFVHSAANQVSHLANHITARASNVIVTNTMDYAQNSPFLSRYLEKIQIIPPPVEMPPIAENDIEAFRKKANILPGQLIVGMAARLATEKGVEYLVQALPKVLRIYPSVRVLFVGQYKDVLGESAYAKKLAPLIARLGDHWSFLGVLAPKEFSAFFHVADVTVLPSINSTESFGMVQVEAMTCGTPVVATDIPGVRQPVKSTGMGLVVPLADAGSLAEAIIRILDDPASYTGDRAEIAKRFAPATIAGEYDHIFRKLVDIKG